MKKVTAFILCGLSALALAGEKEEEKQKSFSADAEFGLVLTSGNTESSSTRAKLDIKQDLTHWKNNYIFEAFFKEDQIELTIDDELVEDTQTTADKYFASMQSDYKLDSEHRGLFIYGSYEDDKFSGFEYQATLAVGYSNRLFNTEKSWLDYSVGPGYAVAKTTESRDELGNTIAEERSETFAVRLSASYLYNVSKSTRFTQKFSSDVAGDSDKNTKSKSETGLSVNINSTLALKLSYTMQHNTQPPFNKDKLDTTTSTTLVYTY